MTPSACHGLRGVGAKVHDHLLQPARFAQHDGILVRQAHLKGDRRGQRGPQQAGGLLEQGAHTHRTVPLLAAAAEGKDPIDDVPRPLARLPHLPHMLPFPAVRRSAAERHLGVAEDRPEDIVEVMRDAAGQCAERLHALGMPQPQLEVCFSRSACSRPSALAKISPIVRSSAMSSSAQRFSASTASKPRRPTRFPAYHSGTQSQERMPRSVSLDFSSLRRQCLNGRNVDAAMTLIALGTPGRSDRQRAVRPAIRCDRCLRDTSYGSRQSIASSALWRMT